MYGSSCGGVLAVELEEEIQAVGCDCGHIFLAQHPDTVKGKKKPPAGREAEADFARRGGEQRKSKRDSGRSWRDYAMDDDEDDLY